MIIKHMRILKKLQLVKEIITQLTSKKMIAIDLGKQQALDADPRATQQIIFTANCDAGEWWWADN